VRKGEKERRGEREKGRKGDWVFVDNLEFQIEPFKIINEKNRLPFSSSS